MKSKWIATSIISLLLAYGTATVVFTSRDIGVTWDEHHYQTAGLVHLEQHVFAEDHAAPPLSKWIAALYPYYSGDRSDVAFRYAHAVIYALGGGVLAFQLLIWGYSFAAVVFALLFFLCPNLKAMASLNVLDSDLAVWMGLVGLYTWRGISERHAGRQIFGLSFLQGLAMMTKITAITYLPFFGLRVLPLRSRRTIALAALGLFLAAMLTYHFRFLEIGSYGASLGFQWKHSHKGQPILLLGKFSRTGFWYTYLVLFALKNTFPALIAMLAAAVLLIRRPRAYLNALIYWVAPAVLMVALLSIGSVQLGFRYILPSLVLFYLTTALVLDRELRTLSAVRRRFGIAALGALGVALLVTDASTLVESTYLAYFNALAPNPTRNFADSNLDWLQGIPKHLEKKAPPFTPLGDLTATNVFSHPDDKPVSISAGATDLSYGWDVWYPERELGPKLAQVGRTIWTGAGYEILEVSRKDLCGLWRANDGASGSDVLVVGAADLQPNWVLTNEPGSRRHPFRVDGKPEFHEWRAWIPAKDVTAAKFISPKGDLLAHEQFKTVQCD